MEWRGGERRRLANRVDGKTFFWGRYQRLHWHNVSCIVYYLVWHRMHFMQNTRDTELVLVAITIESVLHIPRRIRLMSRNGRCSAILFHCVPVLAAFYPAFFLLNVPALLQKFRRCGSMIVAAFVCLMAAATKKDFFVRWSEQWCVCLFVIVWLD